MKAVISIGNQDFGSIRDNKYFYVDKTDFIREWWENGDVVTLITRPRRFGKTLNMSMPDVADILKICISGRMKNIGNCRGAILLFLSVLPL